MGKAVNSKTVESGKNRSKEAASTRSSRGAKLSPAGSKIVSAFHEAIQAMRSGEPPEKPITVRAYRAAFVCPAYGPEDVQRVRQLLGMSQVFFARFLGVDPNTVRSWEQGVRPPSPIARRFMGMIEEDPQYWRRRVARSLMEHGPTEADI